MKGNGFRNEKEKWRVLGTVESRFTPDPMLLNTILYFVYNVVVVYEKSRIPGYDPHVAYVAHIIGFLTGLPFGIALSDHWKRNLLITLLLLGAYFATVTGAVNSLFR